MKKPKSKLRKIPRIPEDILLDIISFLKTKSECKCRTDDIYIYFSNLKRENPDKYRKIRFTKLNYSPDLERILAKLVNKAVINQSGGYTSLTNYFLREYGSEYY